MLLQSTKRKRTAEDTDEATLLLGLGLGSTHVRRAEHPLDAAIRRLASTRSRLASTRSHLASTRSRLASTRTRLDTTYRPDIVACIRYLIPLFAECYCRAKASRADADAATNATRRQTATAYANRLIDRINRFPAIAARIDGFDAELAAPATATLATRADAIAAVLERLEAFVAFNVKIVRWFFQFIRHVADKPKRRKT
jgi:O-acetyl-ADP-ribose deacetylase (regulator of RNase III)